MDECARFLFLEMGRGGAGNVITPGQIDLDNRVPVAFLHFMEDLIPQNSGVIDHCVAPAQLTNRSGDQVLCSRFGRDIVGIEAGSTPRRLNFSCDFGRRSLVGPVAVDGRT